MRARPARAEDSGPASGPSGPLGRGEGCHSSAPWLRGVLAGGRTQVFRPDEGKRAFSAHVSGPNCFGNVSRCIRKKKNSPQGPYFFVSLTSSEVTRICKMSQDAHEGPKSLPGRLHRLSLSGKLLKLLFQTRAQHTRAAFPHSRWAATFSHQCIPVTSPVLDLQVQLHQPPAHEKRSPRWLSILWSPVTASTTL